MDDIFDLLNADIAKALEKTNLRKKAANLKKQAFDRTIGQAVRNKAMLEYRETLAQIEIEMWQPIGTAALMTEQQCDGCGSIHRTFLQYMEIQQHRSRPTSRRWMRVSFPHPTLPREVVIQPNKTHICPNCCDEHGFDTSTASFLGVGTTALTVSDNYLQGDINAPASGE